MIELTSLKGEMFRLNPDLILQTRRKKGMQRTSIEMVDGRTILVQETDERIAELMRQNHIGIIAAAARLGRQDREG